MKKYKFLLGLSGVIGSILPIAAVVACEDEKVAPEVSVSLKQAREMLEVVKETTFSGDVFRSLTISEKTAFNPETLGLFEKISLPSEVVVHFSKVKDSSDVRYYLEDKNIKTNNTLDFTVRFTKSKRDELEFSQVKQILESETKSTLAQSIFNNLQIPSATFAEAQEKLGLRNIVLPFGARVVVTKASGSLAVQYNVQNFYLIENPRFNVFFNEFAPSPEVSAILSQLNAFYTTENSSSSFFIAELQKVNHDSSLVNETLGFSVSSITLPESILKLQVSKSQNSSEVNYEIEYIDSVSSQTKTFSHSVTFRKSIPDNEILEQAQQILQQKNVSTKSDFFQSAIDQSDINKSDLEVVLGLDLGTTFNPGVRISLKKAAEASLVSYNISFGKWENSSFRVSFVVEDQSVNLNNEQILMNLLSNGSKTYRHNDVVLNSANDDIFTVEIAQKFGFDSFMPRTQFTYYYSHNSLNDDGLINFQIKVKDNATNNFASSVTPESRQISVIGIDESQLLSIKNSFLDIKTSTQTISNFYSLSFEKAIFSSVSADLGFAWPSQFSSGITALVSKTINTLTISIDLSKSEVSIPSFNIDFNTFNSSKEELDKQAEAFVASITHGRNGKLLTTEMRFPGITRHDLSQEYITALDLSNVITQPHFKYAFSTDRNATLLTDDGGTTVWIELNFAGVWSKKVALPYPVKIEGISQAYINNIKADLESYNDSIEIRRVLETIVVEEQEINSTIVKANGMAISNLFFKLKWDFMHAYRFENKYFSSSSINVITPNLSIKFSKKIDTTEIKYIIKKGALEFAGSVNIVKFSKAGTLHVPMESDRFRDFIANTDNFPITRELDVLSAVKAGVMVDSLLIRGDDVKINAEIAKVLGLEGYEFDFENFAYRIGKSGWRVNGSSQSIDIKITVLNYKHGDYEVHNGPLIDTTKVSGYTLINAPLDKDGVPIQKNVEEIDKAYIDLAKSYFAATPSSSLQPNDRFLALSYVNTNLNVNNFVNILSWNLGLDGDLANSLYKLVRTSYGSNLKISMDKQATSGNLTFKFAKGEQVGSASLLISSFSEHLGPVSVASEYLKFQSYKNSLTLTNSIVDLLEYVKAGFTLNGIDPETTRIVLTQDWANALGLGGYNFDFESFNYQVSYSAGIRKSTGSLYYDVADKVYKFPVHFRIFSKDEKYDWVNINSISEEFPKSLTLYFVGTHFEEAMDYLTKPNVGNSTTQTPKSSPFSDIILPKEV